MLSSASHYARIPKDYAANLRFRRNVLRLCRENPRYRDAAKDACRNDILFYINTFAWTFRPKAKGSEPKVVPFITWQGQDEIFKSLVGHIDRQAPLVAEKSRDAGWSWACCLTADWLWRFHEWTKTGLFSRVGELVDSKSPDSLFWKVRFIHKHLPAWMEPKGWKPQHDTEMYLENPETHSVITGQATTKDMGVAGRCTWAVFDEFSRVPNARAVLDNTKDTSDCRVFVSTHTGPGTCFHDLCTNGVTDKIVTHWSDHPEKRRGLYRYNGDTNRVEVLDAAYEYPEKYQFGMDGTPSGGPFPGLRSPWYDRQCKERSSADVRTNLDIDVQGATSQFFEPQIIKGLLRDCVAPWEGDLEYDPDHARPLVLRQCDGGPLKLWVNPTGECSVPPSKYGSGSDVSAGLGRTPSVCSIVDAVTGLKVAEFVHASMKPERFAGAVVALCKLFSDKDGQPCLLNWEDKGPGLEFGRVIVSLGFRRLWERETASLVDGRRATGLYGWVPGTESKRRALEAYRTAIYDRAFRNLSRPALEETLNYRYSATRDAVEHPRDIDGNDPSGAKSNHGDRVIADAVAWLACQRLGAGALSRPPEDVKPEAAIGSLAWRMELHARAEKNQGYKTPIRRGQSPRGFHLSPGRHMTG